MGQDVAELIAGARNLVAGAEFSRGRGIGISTFQLERIVTSLADALERVTPRVPNHDDAYAALTEYRSWLDEDVPAIIQLNKNDPFVVASIFGAGWESAIAMFAPTGKDPE